MGLIRNIFWIALFLASTFIFTVLFEHGPDNFSKNAQADWVELSKLWQQKPNAKDDAAKK